MTVCALYSFVPMLLPSSLSHTVHFVYKKLGRSLGMRICFIERNIIIVKKHDRDVLFLEVGAE